MWSRDLDYAILQTLQKRLPFFLEKGIVLEVGARSAFFEWPICLPDDLVPFCFKVSVPQNAETSLSSMLIVLLQS